MKIIYCAPFIIGGLVACSSTKNTATSPATPAVVADTAVIAEVKDTVTKLVLADMTDSVSYAIGTSVANFYQQQGFTQLNGNIVAQAIQDIQQGKQPLISDSAANDVMMRYMNQAQQAKSAPNIQRGEAFLAENKTKPNIKTTASGLQYEVLKQGTGRKPLETDTVVCHYAGTLIDGTEFDNSYKRGEPITFPLNGVIRGWTEGVQLMNTGSKYRFYIPHELAYGTNDMGTIPAGSVLVFEVELLKVKPKK